MQGWSLKLRFPEISHIHLAKLQSEAFSVYVLQNQSGSFKLGKKQEVTDDASGPYKQKKMKKKQMWAFK